MAAKTKSMTGRDGGRKLAADHGRQKQKSGGEARKGITPTGSRRTGSSKQRKS
jgi:hypothetical protein